MQAGCRTTTLLVLSLFLIMHVTSMYSTYWVRNHSKPSCASNASNADSHFEAQFEVSGGLRAACALQRSGPRMYTRKFTRMYTRTACRSYSYVHADKLQLHAHGF